MFACSVFFIVVCLFCILYFICICLLLLPTWRIKLMMITRTPAYAERASIIRHTPVEWELFVGVFFVREQQLNCSVL